MTTPTTIGNLTEPDANSAIADYLNGIGVAWDANAERSQTLVGSGGRPDIVVRQHGRRAVVVETEYGRPAVGDAQSRLGERLVGESWELAEVIAVGIGEECKGLTRSEFLALLKRNDPVLSVQLVSAAGVWPEEPMVSRPVDLVAYCEYAQVPQLEIDRRSAEVAEHIDSLGKAMLNGLRSMTAIGDDVLAELADIVGADSVEDATRIVCAIWLTTIDLHNDLASYSPTLRSMGLETTKALRQNSRFGILSQRHLIDAWKIIEGVNYVPVIELAKSSLSVVGRSGIVSEVLRRLEELSDEVNELQAKHVYNFAGELWQRLVTDREERAAHYTRPEVAELLATLSAQRFNDRSVEEIASVNLMDAASGTGTLIGAGERALRRLYLLKDGNDPNLHRKRMENHIIALDVDGIAGTLTAKRLTDMEVTQDYHDCRIAVVTHEAGSLCLLNPESTGISDMLGSGGRGMSPDQDNNNGTVRIPVGSVDWALMNPPYSRPRRGRRQATTGLSPLRTVASKYGWKMSHGQAGLGSDFGNMSNIRLKPGGVFAHVLPLTAAHAGSWTAWRIGMEKDFEDVTIITNTSSSDLQSMSADTQMSEMLVVATKRKKRPDRWRPTDLLCVNLGSAPGTMSEGYSLAREIAEIPADEKSGATRWGNWTRVTQRGPGDPWGAIGNRNVDLVAIAEELLDGNVYDPELFVSTPMSLPMTTLSELADTGPTHHTIGYPSGGDPIGAFEWTSLDELPVRPTHRSMWAADGKNQTKLIVEPTHGGSTIDRKLARQVTAQRSRWFVNRNLAWASQALAVAKTRALVHGGRTWNAFQNVSDENAKCITLFSNSIFGAIVRRAYGQKGQRGPRAAVQVGAIAGIPCPAFHADTPEAETARSIADAHFDRLSKLTLEPFVFCFRDKNRYEIDNVVARMLGLDPDDSDTQAMMQRYRMLFASEPNVNGRSGRILGALGEFVG
ncbi:MAG: hypothetical protein OXC83_05740 [Chloroflexi bacterium]|nr:hypothetical protein [Chloroflexota bacterium]